MENNNVIESVSYDDRKKELTHKTEEVRTPDNAKLTLNSKAVLNEKGIRETVKNLSMAKKNLKENIKALTTRLGETPKMTESLTKLKADLILLEKIRHDETLTPEQKSKEEADLMKSQTELKKIEKDLKQIKDAIGTRLKF